MCELGAKAPCIDLMESCQNGCLSGWSVCVIGTGSALLVFAVKMILEMCELGGTQG